MIMYSSQDLLDLKSPKDSPWTSGLIGQALVAYDIRWFAMRKPHDNRIIERIEGQCDSLKWDIENILFIHWTHRELMIAGLNYTFLCFDNITLEKLATAINKIV